MHLKHAYVCLKECTLCAQHAVAHARCVDTLQYLHSTKREKVCMFHPVYQNAPRQNVWHSKIGTAPTK
jgi:hypothetical protein